MESLSQTPFPPFDRLRGATKGGGGGEGGAKNDFKPPLLLSGPSLEDPKQQSKKALKKRRRGERRWRNNDLPFFSFLLWARGGFQGEKGERGGMLYLKARRRRSYKNTPLTIAVLAY